MVYVLLHRTPVTLNSNDKCFLCIPENKLSLFWPRAHIRSPPFTPLKISYPGTRTLLRSRKNFNISSMELILVVMPKSLQRMHKISWKKKATCNENLIEQTQWKREKKNPLSDDTNKAFIIKLCRRCWKFEHKGGCVLSKHSRNTKVIQIFSPQF